MTRHFTVLVDACSASSASIGLILRSLHSNGCDIPPARRTVGGAEIGKPKKNRFHRAGMTTTEMISQTLDCVPDLLFKLQPHHLKNEVGLLDALIQRNCRFVSLYRNNLLDAVLCSLRDFSEYSGARSGEYKTFSAWRHSDERKSFWFQCEPKRIVKMIEKKEKKHNDLQSFLDEHLPEVPRISTEMLHGYQSDTSQDALDNSLRCMSAILDQFGLAHSPDQTRKVFEEKRGTRDEPYSHNSIRFANHSTREVRHQIEQSGYGKYWRD